MFFVPFFKFLEVLTMYFQPISSSSSSNRAVPRLSFSFAIRPHSPSLQEGPLDGIQC